MRLDLKNTVYAPYALVRTRLNENKRLREINYGRDRQLVLAFEIKIRSGFFSGTECIFLFQNSQIPAYKSYNKYMYRAKFEINIQFV